MNVHVLFFLFEVNPGYEDESPVVDYPRHAHSDHGLGVPMDRRDEETGTSEAGHHRWAKEEEPRDAAILLESLPSKQLGKLYHLMTTSILRPPYYIDHSF